MPVTHTIDRAERIVRLTVTGALSIDEMRRTVDAVVAETEGEGGFCVLSDHRGLSTPSTPAQLEALVEYMHIAGRPFHRARWAVVTSNPASYGMMRLLMVIAERVPILVNVFEDMESAEHWLRTSRETVGALEDAH
jgi:hypothetical protein